MTNTETSINLDSLRTELAARLTLLVIVGAGVGAWLSIPISPFPRVTFLLFALLIAHAILVRRMLHNRPIFGRRLLVAGWLILLLAAMAFLEEAWVPYLGLLVAFASAVLVRRSEVIVSASAAAMAYGLNAVFDRSYALPQTAIILMFGAALALIVASTIYMALEWESQARQRSQALLSEIRDQRAQLAQSNKMLHQAQEMQMRIQQQLIGARKAAEEARRVKEQFAANISHELRTPLNLILGFAAVMYKNPEIYGDIVWPMKLRRDISHIFRNTSHLVEMVDDILDLSRVEIASFALNLEPTPLASLLQEAVQIAGDLFAGQSVRFLVDIEDDLPTLGIDRTRIRQVLLNLLNNARKYTERGSVQLQVRKETDCVRFRITDTGIGIPADKLPRLFDEYYQVDASLRRNHPGTGLGLAISKRFVVAHGGQIEVESIEGVGTTVIFTLPLQQPLYGSPIARPTQTTSDTRPRVLLLNADRYIAARVAHDLKQYDIITPDEVGDLHEVIHSLEPRAILWNNVSKGEGDRPSADHTLPIPLIDFSLFTPSSDHDKLSPFELLPKPITCEQLLAKLETFGNPRRILVVDDDIGFTQLVERFLETSSSKYDVLKAYTAHDGLDVMRTSDPDLVLLDIIMPDLNGFQMLDIILGDEQLHTIPVVLLAASDRPDNSDVMVTGSIQIQNAMGFRAGEVVHLLGRILDGLIVSRSR